MEFARLMQKHQLENILAGIDGSNLVFFVSYLSFEQKIIDSIHEKINQFIADQQDDRWRLNGVQRSIHGRGKKSKKLFLQKVLHDLAREVKHNKKSIEKLAASFGIFNKTEVKEYTELAIVYRARYFSGMPLSIEEKFRHIVNLYESQVNLSHRTSQSVLLQQYSTPAPISFLAGIFVNADQDISVFEPSAGNGLLTIAARPENVVVNEIGEVRRSNLEEQGYKQVLKQDATLPFL